MKKILIAISQIIIFAIVHSWITIECIKFTEMISLAMKESETVREIYSNPGIATLVLFVLLPIFEGAVIGLVLWLIYRKVGIEKITLYIMVVYLIASFILTLILNVDYNSENVAFSILVFIENHILSSVVFVCSILSMTVYGYRFKQFFSKVFETEEEDKR